MIPAFLRFGVLLALSLSSVASAEVARVVYPRAESVTDSRYRYDYELLRLALLASEATHGAFELRESDCVMNQARAAEEIAAGSGLVNVFARSTSAVHEQRLLPVRFPLDKGLVSYRLFLIRADMQARFAAVRTLDDLRRFSVGSLLTWADTTLLREAGFNVVTGYHYEGLFRMLVGRRFDFFSRSADEAWRELDERSQTLPDMRVENELLLFFPTTRYFFVQRSAQGERLARRIGAGLEAMLRDGSFESFFRLHKGAAIKRSEMGRRRVFRIGNPLQSQETQRLRVERPELWFEPVARL